MSSLNRRQFLQLASASLGTVGLSQADFLAQTNRYRTALAQPAVRKLALLVGVNNYPPGITNLKGCSTDVRMQYELLRHRFGFEQENIYILGQETELLPQSIIRGAPTRDNILNAFETHLIAQANPDDVVVFHFSGHGARVIDENSIAALNGLNGTILPSDARGPDGTDTLAKDIMGKTLFLLTSRLNTEKVTTVLDCCFAGGGIRGGRTYRSLDFRYSEETYPHPDEIDYQRQLRADLGGLSEDALLAQRERGVAKGIGIGATTSTRLSADLSFGSERNRFHVGAFTSLLTRYLWLQSQVWTQPIASAFEQFDIDAYDVAREGGVLNQVPLFETSARCRPTCEQDPIYFITTENTSPAEAVVTDVSGDRVTFWMGGIAPDKLNLHGPNSTFFLLTPEGEQVGQLKPTDREGLVGYGVVEGGAIATEGMFLQEQVRIVPPIVTLKMAVDTSIPATLREVTTQALNRLNKVEVVLAEAESFDYLLGYMSDEARVMGERANIRDLPANGALCLFKPGLTPVPYSWKSAAALQERPVETVSDMVRNHIAQQLSRLASVQTLKLISGTETSRMSLWAQMISGDANNIVGAFCSERGYTLGSSELLEINQDLMVGSPITLEVRNGEMDDIYLAVLLVNDTGVLSILHPLSVETSLVPAGEILRLPQLAYNSVPYELANTREVPVGTVAGAFELLVIASKTPLTSLIKTLKPISRSILGRQPDPIESVEVAAALFADLSQTRGTAGGTDERRAIDTTTFSAISKFFQVRA